MCAGLWHGETHRLPAHFIHPCWQPRLLFTLCSAHMASKHITKAEITFWNLTLKQLPQNTKTHPLVYAVTSTSAPRSALLQSHQVLCGGSVILRRSNLSIPLSTSDHAAQSWGVLSLLWPYLVCLQPLFHSYTCFCCNFSWMQHPLPSPQPYLTTNTVFILLHNLLSTFPGFPCVLIICLL